jgi:hypothetical protein
LTGRLCHEVEPRPSPPHFPQQPEQGRHHQRSSSIIMR